MTADGRSSPGLRVGLAVGVPIMAVGVRGALVDASLTHPAELARWVVGAAVVHDVVVAPAVLAAGWSARRLTPPAAWPVVRWGLVTTGVLALLAWPLVRGYGRDPAVPSLLPRDYATGLAVAVAGVWLAVAAVLAWRRRPGAAGRSSPVP